MNVLLKVVQGPNAGAEIALACGMTVSLGKGDSCDILLADQSLGDVACELEVIGDRVRMLLPGGAEERLEPFRVRFIGDTTAIAVGPETGAWDELVWPSRGAAPATENGSDAAEPVPQEVPAASGRGRGCFFAAAVFLAAVCAALAFLLREGRGDALLAACGRFSGGAAEEAAPAAPAVPDIRDVAEEYGLSCFETNGACVLSGNFPTRARRLAAAAAAYGTRPGVTLDLSDDESVASAAAEVLDLVSEGALKVHSATNRAVEISGFSPGAASLRMALEAIRADVPHVESIDCSRVMLGERAAAEAEPAHVCAPPAAPEPVRMAESAPAPVCAAPAKPAPKMPVVGVMTFPYPCIVLKDGSRVMEGAEFGGFAIEKIGADTIRVRGPEGAFEWKP